MESAFFFAIISPFIWAFVNILDKYVIVKKVKHLMSFITVGGIFSFIILIIITLFLNWTNISLQSIIIPIITGLLYGIQVFLYYRFLKKEDASSLVGFVYTYPLIITILSFLFLNEILSLVSYLGVVLILTGVLMLSIRLKKIKLKVTVWLIITVILITSLYEFLIKISTSIIPVINGITLQLITANSLILFTLLNKKIRNNFSKELKNLKWAALTEILTFFATFTIYLAMSGLSPTIVSSISAVQPLIVLFYERIADKLFGKMQRDHLLLPKLSAISLIVLGIVLLYIGGIE